MDHVLVHLVCGAMSVCGTLMTVLNVRRGMKSTQTATGTVLRIDRTEDADGVSFSPVVEFGIGTRQTRAEFMQQDQKIVLDQLFGWPRPPRLKEGDEVTVYFPMGEPAKGRLSRWSWFEIAIPALVGSVGIITWIWFIIRGK